MRTIKLHTAKKVVHGKSARPPSRITSAQQRHPARKLQGRDHDPSAPLPLSIKLVLALVLVLAITGVGLAADVLLSGASHIAPQRLNALVEVPGGAFRVDRVVPEHMVPMQHEKFAQSGMAMSAMGMDMAPEGFRRFTVEVTLVGHAASGLQYTVDQFQVSGEGVSAAAPLRHLLGNGVVPAGSAMSGTLVFEVPEEAEHLQLRFKGVSQPIALEPGSHTGSDHGNGE